MQIDKEEVKEFFDDVSSDLAEAEGLLLNWGDAGAASDTVDKLFRFFHNIKGTSGMFGLVGLQELFHVAEDLLSVYRENKTKPNEQTIENLVEVIDTFKKESEGIVKSGAESKIKPYHLLARLSDAKAKPEESTGESEAATDSKAEEKSKGSSDESIRISGESANELVEIVSDFIQLQNRLVATLGDDSKVFATKNDIARFSTRLQQFVLSIRLAPVGPLLNGLQRVVRAAAKETDKKVRFKVSGGDTQLDRRVIDLLRDPLIHLVRNSVDHGLETPEERKNVQKKPEGDIAVEAAQQAGQVVITIVDDGRGINPEGVKKKAIEKGVVTEEVAATMSDRDLVNLVFAPGFSTKEVASNISGRGVGMDAVKTAVESIGGSVEISSVASGGTKVVLTLPLTLAIVKALTFYVGRQLYAVPQNNVEEVITQSSLEINGKVSSLEDGQKVLRIRKSVIPVVSMSKVLETDSSEESKVFVVVRQRGQRFALEVDRIAGTRDFVSQPIPALFSPIAVISGVNQLNSGEYIGLLDLTEVARLVSNNKTERVGFKGSQRENEAAQEGTESDIFRSQQKLVFFKSGKDFAVPVQAVRQVITCTADAIDGVGDKLFLTYKGQIFPILRLYHHFGGLELRKQDTYTVLVTEREGKNAAIICEDFHGIHRLPPEFENLVKTRGILGTTNLKGKTFIVANAYAIFELEFPNEFDKAAETTSDFTVLVVEDDSFFAASLEEMLSSNDCKVVVAQDGLEGKKALEASVRQGGKQIDYVVTDLEMPNMNGLELLRWLRKDEKLSHVPALMCTAVGDEGTRREAEALGIDNFCGKMKYDDVLISIEKRKRMKEVGVVEEVVHRTTHLSGDTAAGEKRVLTFHLGDNVYGIEIDFLKEISAASVSTEMPGSQIHAQRMIAFRGYPIPVLDLRVISGSNSGSDPEQIVAKFGDHFCALWVDSISNVRRMRNMDRADGVTKKDFGRRIVKLVGDVLWDDTGSVAMLSGDRIRHLLQLTQSATKPLSEPEADILAS